MKTKTVLVAVDFSAITAKVVSTAVEIARAIGARLLLRHIVQMPPAAINFYAVGQDPSPVLDDAQRDAGKRLAGMSAAITALAVETSCPIGDPATEICREAEAHKADFIVLGSHGHGALYELLVGSSAQGVLRRAKCPVLIVPAAAPEGAEQITAAAVSMKSGP